MAKNKTNNKSGYVGAPKKDAGTGKGSAPKDAVKSKGKYVCTLTDLSGQDGFVRKEPTAGRWSQGMSAFTGNFSKNVLLNLVMLVFLAPIIYLVIRTASELFSAYYAAPYGANMIFGLMPVGNMAGLKESIIYSVMRNFFLFLPLGGIVFAVGLAGAAYYVRNLLWGADAPLFTTFFKGIKHNWFNVLIFTAFFSLVLSAAGIGVTSIAYQEAIGNGTWYFTVIKICAIAVAAFFAVWCFTAVSLTTTYKATFFHTLRNSLRITFFMLPLNVLFLALALCPFALLLVGGSFTTIFMMLIALFGVTFALITWTTYSQWIYAKFINPNVTEKYKPTEKELADLEKKKQSVKAKEEEGGFVSVGTVKVREENFIKPRLTAQPVTQGETVTADERLTRDDLVSLSEAKARLKAAAKEYAEKNAK